MPDPTTTTAAAAPAVVEHEHVYDARWYPEDRHTVRRVCVLPGCTETQRKQPKA